MSAPYKYIRIMAFLCVASTCGGAFGQDGNSIANKKARWKNHAPDATLTLRMLEFYDADKQSGYKSVSSSMNAVERIVQNKNTIFYEVTPIEEIVRSSAANEEDTVYINKNLESTYAYTRNPTTQIMTSMKGGDLYINLANDFVKSLPHFDNRASGVWIDEISPQGQLGKFFQSPFSAVFGAHQTAVNGETLNVGFYCTETFRQPLSDGLYFDGKIRGVVVERAAKDKAPVVAMRVHGDVKGAQGFVGRIDSSSFSVRQGADLTAVKAILSDKTVGSIILGALYSPLERQAKTNSQSGDGTLKLLPDAPQWIDKFEERMNIRNTCLLIQLEMRTNAGWGDYIVGVGKKIKGATGVFKEGIEKLPSGGVSGKIKSVVEVVAITLDSLAGPCIEAIGHIVNGDMDTAGKVMDNAYLGSDGFFAGLGKWYLVEVGDIIDGNLAPHGNYDFYENLKKLADILLGDLYKEYKESGLSDAEIEKILNENPVTDPYLNPERGTLVDDVIWEYPDGNPDAPVDLSTEETETIIDDLKEEPIPPPELTYSNNVSPLYWGDKWKEKSVANEKAEEEKSKNSTDILLGAVDDYGPWGDGGNGGNGGNGDNGGNGGNGENQPKQPYEDLIGKEIARVIALGKDSGVTPGKVPTGRNTTAAEMRGLIDSGLTATYYGTVIEHEKNEGMFGASWDKTRTGEMIGTVHFTGRMAGIVTRVDAKDDLAAHGFDRIYTDMTMDLKDDGSLKALRGSTYDNTTVNVGSIRRSYYNGAMGASGKEVNPGVAYFKGEADARLFGSKAEALGGAYNLTQDTFTDGAKATISGTFGGTSITLDPNNTQKYLDFPNK